MPTVQWKGNSEAMKQPFKPHNKRKPAKQSTSVAPGITLEPSKTPEGRFIVLGLESQRQKHITSKKRIEWDGRIQPFLVKLDFAIVELAEYQHHMYGDEWDVRDLRTMVLETWKQFTMNARTQVRRVKGLK